MPNDADRAGTPAGVFGAELRFYRTRAGLSQKDLAAKANVSHDVISKIETGERPPAEDFPPRLDAIPELDTRGALTRLWDHLKKGQKQRLYGWFQEWADIETHATVLRWYEPLVVTPLNDLGRSCSPVFPTVVVVSVAAGGCRWWWRGGCRRGRGGRGGGRSRRRG